MTSAPWALAALVCWHAGAAGGLPREIATNQVHSYITGERLVRVVVVSGATSLALRPEGPMVIEVEGRAGRAVAGAGAGVEVKAARGEVEVRAGGLRAGGPRVRLIPRGDGAVVVSPRGGVGRRGRYGGTLEVAALPSGLRVVEHVELERYIAGVVAAEVPPSFPLEAQRAQAIAARTYALYHLGDHEGEGADLCGQVHCQAYGGLPPSGSIAREAVETTAGLALTYQGLLVDAVYHAACGGATAPGWVVRQGKLLPYLAGAPDREGAGAPFCGLGHRLEWTTRFSQAAAERLVARNLGRVLCQPGLDPGALVELRVAGRRGLRVEGLEVKTSRGQYLVRGDAVRWLLGTGRPGAGGLRSTAFALEVERDRRGRPRTYVFRGVGHGHGLGLCQWGARGRAEAGQRAEEMLAAYYPGAMVTDLRAE